MTEVFGIYQAYEGVLDNLGVFASREGAEKAMNEWLVEMGIADVHLANDFRVVSLKVSP